MEQVVYKGISCVIVAENGQYVTLKEIDTGILHLSIHIKELTHESS